MAGEIRALTGLRGVAAVSVVVYHFVQYVPVPASSLHTLAMRGYLAVDVFFVLSGFVMALTYGRMFAGGFVAAAYREFLLRRVARIVPLYLVALGLVMADRARVGFTMPGDGNPVVLILANFLLVQSWGIAPSLIAASWSVSTEIAAYLVFPVVLQVTLFRSRRHAGDGVLIATLLLVGAAAGGRLLALPGNGALDLSDGTSLLPLMRCLGGFILGLVAFRAAQSPRVMAIVGHDRFAVAVFLLFLSGLWYGMPDLTMYPLLPLIVLVAYANRGLPTRLLACPPVHWLGECSYAIYLLHGEVLHVSGRLLHVLAGSSTQGIGRVIAAMFIGIFVLSLAGAAHRWIEVPARRVLRNPRVVLAAALGVAVQKP